MIEIVNVVVFEKATGKILSTGMTCLPEKLESDTVGVLTDCLADIEGDYVQAGKVVSKGKKPTLHHTFDYATKQWVDPRTPETEWPLVRAKRDELLLASDWTQLPDVPLATKEAWAVYRQALRDITQQADPFAIVWPVAPA